VYCFDLLDARAISKRYLKPSCLDPGGAVNVTAVSLLMLPVTSI
jgi:hypothetical protein